MFYRIAMKKHPGKCKVIVKFRGVDLISAIYASSRLRRSQKVRCRVEGPLRGPSTRHLTFLAW